MYSSKKGKIIIHYTFYSTQVNKLITENIEEITNVKISFIDYYEQ